MDEQQADFTHSTREHHIYAASDRRAGWKQRAMMVTLKSVSVGSSPRWSPVAVACRWPSFWFLCNVLMWIIPCWVQDWLTAYGQHSADLTRIHAATHPAIAHEQAASEEGKQRSPTAGTEGSPDRRCCSHWISRAATSSASFRFSRGALVGKPSLVSEAHIWGTNGALCTHPKLTRLVDPRCCTLP